MAKNMIELPRLPNVKDDGTWSFSSRSSHTYGRRHLQGLLTNYELWDTVLALKDTHYLRPGSSAADRAKYLRLVAVAQINTDQARELIGEQLLAVAEHYIKSCIDGLAASPLACRPQQVVEFGHRVVRYRQLVQEHNVDLLVTNTKQEDQLAINGLAHALSVELTEVPQLLL